MKKLLSLTAFLLSLISFAQVPQGISYQAIALNASGGPVVSSNVGIRLTILDNSATGTVLYTETQVKTTNAQGLYNLVIGQGTPTTGTFSTINWGTNTKFLKVEMDATGGTSYTLVGSTQLLSVPYALMAGGIAANSNANDDIAENKYSNFAFYSTGNYITYAFNQKTGTWVGQSGSGTIIESNGNFAFYNSGNYTTYAFSKNTNTWVGQSGSGTIVASNGNFAFYSNVNNITYAFNQKTGTWVGQSGNGTIVASNGNFAFYSNVNNITYAFNQKTGTWVGQSGNGTITESNGNFAFYSNTNNTTYVFNKNTNTWVGQSGGSSTLTVSPSN